VEILSTLIGNYYGIDWAAFMLMFSSSWLLARKNRLGFLAAIGSNVCWFSFGILAGSFADPLANTIVCCMNIYAFTAWRKSAAMDRDPAWLYSEKGFPSPTLQ
jgi:hypothetical protein